ncbi:hypothetical protein FBU30_010074, partial [Linnemannia zychae]
MAQMTVTLVAESINCFLMAIIDSSSKALFEKAPLTDSANPELPKTTINDSEIELLADTFSKVDNQPRRCDSLYEDEAIELTEAEAAADDGLEDSANISVDSVDSLGVYSEENPSVKADEDEDPGVDPTAFLKAEPAAGTPLERLQNELATSFNSIVLREVRSSFEINEIVQREALLLGEPIIDDTLIKFWLSPEGYNEWLQQHQAHISTNFIPMKGSYKFTSKKRAGNQHIYLQCQRAGKKYEIKGRTRGGKSGKPRIRKASIKIGCPAKLQIQTQKRQGPDGILQSVYEVTYLYQHNHGVGCFSSVGTRQKSNAIKATIKKLILGDSAIAMVTQQLTMEHDKFTQIMRQKGRYSRDDFITYDDVYSIWYSIMVNKMRKDDDAVVSSVKWMEELENDGAFTYYDKDDRVGGLYFGFSTTWQMNQLRAYGRTICFDGTHNVFGQKTNLFTLVVKNTSTGFGVPVAFLLTSSTENSILVDWLRALRSKMIAIFSSPDPDQLYVYKPNAVITDQGNVEILAIKTAFAGENVPIFFCAWHVYRAWEREVRKRITGIAHLPVEERKTIKDAAIAELKSILGEQDKQKAFQGIQRYREKWNEHDDLLHFLNKNYFGQPQDEPVDNIRKHWMTCYRQ